MAGGGTVPDVDVTDSSGVRDAAVDIERTLGPIELAVGAAGVLVERPFHSVADDL